MIRHSIPGRHRAGPETFRPPSGTSDSLWRNWHSRTLAKSRTGQLLRSKLWHGAMAMLVAAPLLTAGAFEQLPWQVDSQSETARSLSPSGNSPPENGVPSESVATAGTPESDMTHAITQVSSPTAQAPDATPTRYPVQAASAGAGFATATRTATASATSTATPVSPSPSPSPTIGTTPTEQPDRVEMIVTSPLNVRNAPGINAGIRGVLERGARVSVTAGPLEEDGYAWYEIAGDGITGWAAGEFLEPA